MNRFFLVLSLFVLFAACNNSSKQPVDYVDPMIGTGGTSHTFPGAVVPFGMVQLSPDNRTRGWQFCSGYHNMDTSIMGFSHTHLSGTGATDLGDILLMPTTGVVKTVPGDATVAGSGYRSNFSHDNEHAEPGYYQVYLTDYDVNVELTATKRVGFHRYTFPESDSSNVIIDLKHGIGDRPTELDIEVTGESEITGMRRSRGWSFDHRLYFVAQFSKPFTKYGIVRNDTLIEGKKGASVDDLKAFVNFTTEKDEKILVRVGISAVSVEAARKNLNAELTHWDFDKICAEAKATWNTALSKYSVEGGSDEQKTIFYTAFYHTMIQPSLYCDVDGSYRGRDGKIHKAKGFNLYTTFSLWDTYRAENPLFTLIDTTMVNDWIQSFLREYKEGGRLPVWSLASCETECMIGYHSIPVIADAYMKGIRNYDTELAFEAMKHSATLDHFGLYAYKNFHYIPHNEYSEGVSRTLEYAYDDWCIAQMAKEMGKTDDYNTFIKRAQYYKNVYDPTTGFMRGREKGKWYSPFDPKDVSHHYTEANAWQYTFYVPQDVTGLVELFRGKEAFVKKLDQLFVEESDLGGRDLPDISGLLGQYVHGNEPSHHMAYLYNYVGEPWKTQARVSQLIDTMYTAEIDGLAGNDDCGQMSAWYVFNAMGFYPVTPGAPIYIIGSPIFEKTTVNLANGKQMVIEAKNVSKKNVYIQSATLNGQEYTKSYISHADIMNGGNLIFEMGPEPNKNWGTKPEDLPVSEINDSKIVSNPYFINTEDLFEDTISVTMKCFPDNATIYYTLDGSEPTNQSLKYTKPVTINATTVIKAVGYMGNEKSSVETLEMKKAKWYSPISKSTKPGVFYKYYEGNFRKIPDFKQMTALSSGSASGFDLKSVREREDSYLLQFTGYIDVPVDGIYTFYTKSDDGSKLYINKELVVDNDGLHGPIELSGKIALKAGKHPFILEYMEGAVDETLEVSYETESIEKQQIPVSRLSH